MNMDALFQYGTVLSSKDIVDQYTFLAVYYKLDNYRLFTLDSILKSKVTRNDIPEYVFDFIADHGQVLGIANRFNNKVDYIIFKSLTEKKFLTAGSARALPYGVGSFSQFHYGDWIVVVEGLKDCDAMSQIYPNTVATQTAGMGTVLREVLTSMTNRFILFYDQDESGEKAYKRDFYKLRDLGCQVVKGQHPYGTKDSGEIVDTLYKGDSFQAQYLEEFYRSQITAITGGRI